MKGANTMTIKIINETVYNDDDLQALLYVVRDATLKEFVERGARNKKMSETRGVEWTAANVAYFASHREPTEVRVGYYACNPPKPDRYGSLRERQGSERYCSVRGTHSDSPRIGIVRADRLPLPPLVVLAHCAENATRDVPTEVVDALICVFSKCFDGNISSEYREFLAARNRVRFSLNPKQGSKEAMRKASRAGRIRALLKKRSRLQERLDVLTSEIDVLDQKLHKLQPEKELSPNV
jgi:hypothetical protein